MSNCNSYPRQGREIAVKNALSAAAKARLHRVQRSPIGYKAGECSATKVGRCIHKRSITALDLQILSSSMTYIFCVGVGFFAGCGFVVAVGFFVGLVFLGIFVWLAWLVGLVFFSRTTIHILWKCLNGEANCTSLGHRKRNLGASNSTQQI